MENWQYLSGLLYSFWLWTLRDWRSAVDFLWLSSRIASDCFICCSSLWLNTKELQGCFFILHCWKNGFCFLFSVKSKVGSLLEPFLLLFFCLISLLFFYVGASLQLCTLSNKSLEKRRKMTKPKPKHCVTLNWERASWGWMQDDDCTYIAEMLSYSLN